MLKYIGKRLLMLIPVMLGIIFIVLVLIDITPGDPARMMLGVQATQEQVEALRDELGLNDPFVVRYVRYIWNIMHGDFGSSLLTNRPVLDEMLARFPYTLMLVAISLCISVCVGIPIGIFAASNQNSLKDNFAMFLALFCVSMPSFWFALMMIREFAVQNRWLPLSGVTSWKGWIMPCVAQALGFTAIIARQTRSNMLEVVRQDYITTARSKGIPEQKIKYRHALKNALTPVISSIGGIFGVMLGGSLIAEVIFSIPGLGQYTMSALGNRDYPVMQSSILILSTLFAIVILLVDVIFALVDPRIRSQYTRKRKRKSTAAETKEEVRV